MAQSKLQSIQSKVEDSNIYAVKPKAKPKGKVSTTVEGVELNCILDKHYSTNDKGDKHSLRDAIKKVPSIYRGMKKKSSDLLMSQLEIGRVILRCESEGLKLKDVKELKAIDKRDRSDMKFVASHWDEIQALVEAEGTKSVYDYNVGSLRKKLQQAQKDATENVGTSDQEKSGGASDGASANEDAPTREVRTPVDLANEVVSICNIKGWSVDHVVGLIESVRK